VLFLSRNEVESLLDPDALRRAVAQAMVEVSDGRASMPPRIVAAVPDRGAVLAAMPAHLPGLGALTTKLLTVFPGNAGGALPTHQALIAVFATDTGEPLAVMDGAVITAARTAAGSALATELLARDDSRVLAIVGTGVQARAHALAVSRVRAFEQIRLAGRDPVKAGALADLLGGELDRPVVAVATIAAACAGADVVCATTDAAEPVVLRRHLSPGAHVTSVGYNLHGHELELGIVVDALLVVESRQAAMAPVPAGAGDIRAAIDGGLITDEHIHAELGELVAGTRPGRATAEQITLYRSVGVAAQDAAAASLVLAAARAQGVGHELAL
jgi:ornithine cyclodeaminase